MLEYLASGMSEAQIVADFPELNADDISEILTFAAQRELPSPWCCVKLLFDKIYLAGPLSNPEISTPVQGM